jgi:hypothetical protein
MPREAREMRSYSLHTGANRKAIEVFFMAHSQKKTNIMPFGNFGLYVHWMQSSVL